MTRFEIVAVLSSGEVTESLLARDGDRSVVIERSHAHDPTWNPITHTSLARARAWFEEQRGYVSRVAHPAILAAYDVTAVGGDRPKVRNITSVPRHGSRIRVTRRL